MFGFLFFPLRLLALVAAGFALAVIVKLGSNLLSVMSGKSDLSWPRKTDGDTTEDEDEPLWKRPFSRISDDG
jgi:hypothetical protein